MEKKYRIRVSNGTASYLYMGGQLYTALEAIQEVNNNPDRLKWDSAIIVQGTKEVKKLNTKAVFAKQLKW